MLPLFLLLLISWNYLQLCGRNNSSNQDLVSGTDVAVCRCNPALWRHRHLHTLSFTYYSKSIFRLNTSNIFPSLAYDSKSGQFDIIYLNYSWSVGRESVSLVCGLSVIPNRKMECNKFKLSPQGVGQSRQTQRKHKNSIAYIETIQKCVINVQIYVETGEAIWI